MTKKNVLSEFTGEEQNVIKLALEFYIRMGLGQFSEIAQRLNLLYGDKIGDEKLVKINQLCDEMAEVLWGDDEPWQIKDSGTSLYIMTAFLIDAKVNNNTFGIKYALKRIEEIRKLKKESIEKIE